MTNCLHDFKQWEILLESLTELRSVEVPRCNLIMNQSVVLNGYADGFYKTYGAVIYIQTFNAKETSHLCVSQTKVITITRQHVFLQKLTCKILNSLNKKVETVQ